MALRRNDYVKNIMKRTMGMKQQSLYEKLLVFLINVGFRFDGKDEYRSQEDIS